MELTPGLRREPAFDPSTVESDPVLVERIRAEIAASGAVTFARFMELALYDPERGYYTSPEARPGRSGDFVTAPETHPIFGAAVGRQLDELWHLLGEPDPFTVREDGAAGGTLALAILRGLAADHPPLLDAIRYRPVEPNRHRVAELAARLTEAGFERTLDLDGSGPFTGAVVANEVLDALPVHRVEGRSGGGLVELFVGIGGDRFWDVPGPPSTPALAARLASEGVTLADGQRAEICLGVDGWVAGVARDLERGAALVFDYGYPAAELYGPARREGTLRAYLGHTVHADPYRHVGRQDLTAHVDVTAVERAAAANGLAILGVTTQAEFLVGAGAGELVAAAVADPDLPLADRLALRSAIARLLDPRAMGGFRVVVLGRGLPERATLRGLAYRLRGPLRP